MPPIASLALTQTLLLFCPQLEAGIAMHIRKLVGVRESVLPEDVSGYLLAPPCSVDLKLPRGGSMWAGAEGFIREQPTQP